MLILLAENEYDELFKFIKNKELSIKEDLLLMKLKLDETAI